VPVALHPEVEARVTVNVARSPEEAERQARGESVTTRDELDLDDLGLEVGAALAEAPATRTTPRNLDAFAFRSILKAPCRDSAGSLFSWVRDSSARGLRGGDESKRARAEAA
jgi:hypothetical protein